MKITRRQLIRLIKEELDRATQIAARRLKDAIAQEKETDSQELKDEIFPDEEE
tara:strand:+ start:394 stop:552 length:159 start_codon:yes stop_codon:yes gene_type:complete